MDRYVSKTPFNEWAINLTQAVQYLFPEDDSPKYIMGFSVISAMLAVGVSVFLFLQIWLRRPLKCEITR